MRFEIKKRIRIAANRDQHCATFLQGDQGVRRELSALVETDTAKERVFATIDYVQLPSTNDFFVRVFVNLPSADAQTPTEDPHYAGASPSSEPTPPVTRDTAGRTSSST
jgi:hypothetical protein